MDTGTEDEVNALLAHAQRLRSAATATASSGYRTKMLRAARDLEAQATQIEAAASRMAAE
jgi:hypothetical protein